MPDIAKRKNSVPTGYVIVLGIRINRAATTKGGGEKGRHPPKQKFRPPKMPSMPNQTPLPLTAVSK